MQTRTRVSSKGTFLKVLIRLVCPLDALLRDGHSCAFLILQAINLSQMQLDNAMRQHEYDNLPTTLGLEADPKHFSQGGPHLPIPIPLQGNNFTFGALSPAQLPPHPGTGPLLPPEAKKGIPGAAGGPFAKRNRGGEHVSEDDDGPEDKEAEAAASAIAAMAIGDSESEQEGRILSGGKKRQGSEGGADALPADLSVDAVEEGEGDVRQQQMPNGPQMMQQPGGPFAGKTSVKLAARSTYALAFEMLLPLAAEGSHTLPQLCGASALKLLSRGRFTVLKQFTAGESFHPYRQVCFSCVYADFCATL